MRRESSTGCTAVLARRRGQARYSRDRRGPPRRHPSPTREGGQIASDRSAARFLRHSRFQMDKQGLPSPGSIGEQDIYLFLEGTHGRLYRRLGCQLGEAAARFAVWAPNAKAVAVIGDFNGWRRDAHPARLRGDASGLWEAEVPGVGAGPALQVRDPHARRRIGSRRPTPSRVAAEAPPATASIAWRDDGYAWHDAAWMRTRAPAQRARRADRRSTRCTSARGGAARTARCSTTASCRRPAGRLRHAHGLHARRADAAHRAPVLRLLGLPDDRLFRADVRATARRRTSWPSSTTCTARHRRDPRLGAVALPDRRARPGATSTAPTCTSTPIRARASTRSGTRPSSTTAATRCAASCCRARCSGSTNTTSTACASTAWRRCCTSTTRAAGRMDPEPLRRHARTSRRSRFLRELNEAGVPRAPRHPAHRRGIDRLADGVAADLSRRPRLRAEVEHGLDARHLAVHAQRPGAPRAGTTAS